MHARFLWSRSRLLQPAVLVGASLWADSRRTVVSESEGKNSKDQKDDPKKNNSSSSPEVFDITQKWNEAQNDARDFWKSSIFTKTEEEKKKEEAIEKSQQDKLTFNGKEFPFENAVEKMKDFFGVKDDNANAASSSSTTEKPKDQDSADSFRDMASSFAGLLAGGGSEKTVQRIVKQARESAEEGDIADKKSLEEMMTLLEQYAQDLKKTADKFLGDVDLTKLYPTSLFYYTEYEDSVKNPSWKRRMHRFYPGIDIRQMEELNDFLQLADLSYADTVEEIQRGLEHFKTPYELVMVDTDSDPHRPAHFLAVKRAQTVFSPSLEILWCVRGTKTFEDALTDLLCDFVPYRGGQAHSGVLEGGKHLSQKHKKLLLKLLDSSGKRKIKLTCVGHSLGAGCASIVGMELKEDPRFDVQVIGFGCPALLSKELSEQTQSYITTVVADDDCVPRLSGPSVVNALLNIMEYDYIPSARRDVKHAFQELQRLYPMIVSKSLADTIITDVLDPLMDKFLADGIKEPSSKRMEPVLFPPGKVIHFYRDGVGVTGSVVPCDFFGELHISRRMVDDHLFFTGYQQIFLDLMRQHHKDHYFTFDAKSKPADDR